MISFDLDQMELGHKQSYFRWHKIGHRVFYNPDEVAADLTSDFRVDPPDSAPPKGGSAQ